MTPYVIAAVLVLVIWFQLHKVYRADLANAKAVIEDRAEARVENVKRWALEACRIAQEAVNDATAQTEAAISDTKNAREVIVALHGELERTGSVVVPFRRGGVA